MSVQDTMALMPPVGAATWSPRDLPGRRILASLRAANLAFLELLGGSGSTGIAAVCGVPAPYAHRLAARPEASQAVAGALPFTLFDLRFRDEPFWRSAVAGSASVQDATAAAGAHPGALSFARVALVFAWHAVDVCAPSAALALGTSDGVLRLVGDLPLASIEPLSHRLAPALAARFAGRDLFWQRLTDCLRDPDSQQLERVCLLGLQLHGTDSARGQQLQRRVRRES